VTSPSQLAIATTATRALWRSLRSGFDTVDADVYERRLEACRACEFFVPAPDTLLHALGRVVAEPRVCAQCGCFVFKKARYATEECPAPSADDPAVSRWGGAVGRPDRP
jgi:hypothetical protein